jgi:putative FmdB family regulatory protein
MPTYEYACKTCGEHLEIVQSFKDKPLTECPACGGPLRKVFGNIGITFKGSGFYRTDNRTNGHRSAASPKAGDAKAAQSSSSSDSTTSGAEKSTTKAKEAVASGSAS